MSVQEEDLPSQCKHSYPKTAGFQSCDGDGKRAASKASRDRMLLTFAMGHRLQLTRAYENSTSVDLKQAIQQKMDDIERYTQLLLEAADRKANAKTENFHLELMHMEYYYKLRLTIAHEPAPQYLWPSTLSTREQLPYVACAGWKECPCCAGATFEPLLNWTAFTFGTGS